MASATGVDNHTPFKPNSFGKIITKGINNINCLKGPKIIASLLLAID
jgi:hypothetical protein